MQLDSDRDTKNRGAEIQQTRKVVLDLDEEDRPVVADTFSMEDHSQTVEFEDIQTAIQKEDNSHNSLFYFPKPGVNERREDRTTDLNKSAEVFRTLWMVYLKDNQS
ncbi:MAG: hypothetical protein IPH93_06430 [Saprospiraceae bacterium]|nr:hypothetical protein [Saprospiraceae bacterium]